MHASYNTIVEAEVKERKLIYLQVTPEKCLKDITISQAYRNLK